MKHSIDNDQSGAHSRRFERLATLVFDTFSDDRPAGRVIGTEATSGNTRLGVDVERQVAIDHGALRFQPLIRPGWGRQGIAYGPFQRTLGLALAVSVTNGHNTSQGSSIQQTFLRRVGRWALGPNADPWPARLAAWLLTPRRKGSLRRFKWWLRSTPRMFKYPDLNENLAIGWFTGEAPADPLHDGCGFIVHAAEGENGELWARVGSRCLSAFRRLMNLQVNYVVVLREQGAIYFAAGIEGAYGLGAIPKMRPIAIDPFNSDQELYAGIQQSALGQIGFRVDTRVQRVCIAMLPELASPAKLAQAYDPLLATGASAAAVPLDQSWRLNRGQIRLDASGATADSESFAFLLAEAPSGLIHAIFETAAVPVGAGIAWRLQDGSNYLILKARNNGCTLSRLHLGVETVIATDERHQLKPNATHSFQILDSHGQIGCYLDGDRLFDRWFCNEILNDGTGVGIWFASSAGCWIHHLEAYSREVTVPNAIRFVEPWGRIGDQIEIADDFASARDDLDDHAPAIGSDRWQRTVGTGVISLDGHGSAIVQARVAQPHVGRTLYTLPWRRSDFADLEVTITAPGQERGQSQNCRAGLVFWQDADNYLTFSVYLDDAYQGSSVALFTKRHGFEELYDAVWTMLWDKVRWGHPFRLRVSFDGNHFIVFIDGEPVMQRALTDLYPKDPPLRILRIGLAVNWEWGGDTGSMFESFRARS